MRLLALVALATLGALIFGPVITRDEAMAASRWTPFVGTNAPAAAAPPATGSAEERAELDELLAIQASRTDADIAAARPWLGAGSVQRWNDILLGFIREDKTNPVRASRNMALLNVAIYDAVIAACREQVSTSSPAPRERDGRIKPLADVPARASYPSAEVAVASAAQAVLAYLYPGRTHDFQRLADDARRAPLIAGTSLPAGVDAGAAIGAAVGAAVVARGQADGSTAVWHGQMPTGAGVWKAAPTAVGGPTELMAGTWKTWILASGSELRAPPPPAFGSPEWQRDADEVVSITNNLTNEQVRIARFWADGSGTETPPGHWARIGLGLIARDHLSLGQAARTMAHLGVAQADAFITCWETKYHYWTGRPTGLIKGFASTILTPNFPSYTSGHSTQSGAAAVVLGHFFPHDAAKLDAMADEAAVSRLYGGIHYRSDNEVGLRIGREIGRRTVERAGGGPIR
jgi:hypothetical protein